MKTSAIALLVPLAACMACGSAETGSAREAQVESQAADQAGGVSIPSPRIDWPVPPAGPATASASAEPEGELDRAAIAREIMADPAAYKPETYVFVTQHLWSRGDRLQAAFWHYLFQIRTLPWAEQQRELRPFRAAINESLGGEIHRWLGADYDAWVEMTRRVMAYERRIPLSPERPPGLSEAEWRAQVERSRADWREDFEDVFGPSGPGRASIEADRRASGLPVGPLQDAGAPLPDDWR